jgi:hypothetical protein
MASFAPATGLVDFEEVPAILKCHACALPTIKTAVDFLVCFRSTTNHPDTLALIRSLTDTRATVESMLKDPSSRASPMRIVQAIDGYVPFLFKLMTSLNNQDPVPLDKAMTFEWNSAVDDAVYLFPELVFEIAMCLYAKGILHQREAVRLLEVDRIGNLSLAGQQFLAAAGVLDYLGATLLPKWFPQPGVENRRPVESSPAWCLGLAAFFEGSAQCCAVVKALTKGGTEVAPPYVVLSKLCTGIADKCTTAFDVIDPPILSFVGSAFTECVGFTKEIATALANYYHAQIQYQNGECGLAIAYFRKALVSRLALSRRCV